MSIVLLGWGERDMSNQYFVFRFNCVSHANDETVEQFIESGTKFAPNARFKCIFLCTANALHFLLFTKNEIATLNTSCYEF